MSFLLLLNHDLGFSIGLPRIFWRLSTEVQNKKANKPRHDNHYQPPCFDEFP
jgi:hypothetical protein